MLLWLLYAFVFVKVLPFLGSEQELWLLVIGGFLVLLFNTASVIAMISHLSEVREEVYGLDLRYLDAANAHSKT